MIKKISRKAPLLLAACLAFALVLAGCGGSGSPASDPPPHPIVGIWSNGDGERVFTFHANETFSYFNPEGGYQSGTWADNNGVITLTWYPRSPATVTIDGRNFTFRWLSSGTPSTFTRQ